MIRSVPVSLYCSPVFEGSRAPSVGGEVVPRFTQTEQLNVDEADVVFVLTQLEGQTGGVYHTRTRFTNDIIISKLLLN